MWNIYKDDPKFCGHRLDEIDYTCVGCLYVALCLTRDQLQEAQDFIAEIGRVNSHQKAVISAAYTYPLWALGNGEAVNA